MHLHILQHCGYQLAISTGFLVLAGGVHALLPETCLVMCHSGAAVIHHSVDITAHSPEVLVGTPEGVEAQCVLASPPALDKQVGLKLYHKSFHNSFLRVCT